MMMPRTGVLVTILSSASSRLAFDARVAGGVFMIVGTVLADPSRAQDAARPEIGTAMPQCSIDRRLDGSVLTLRGLVTVTSRVSGRYRLRVTKTGPAGNSNLSQAGEFTAEPTRPSGLGRVAISLEPGARYDAALTLDMSGRSSDCRVSGSAGLEL